VKHILCVYLFASLAVGLIPAHVSADDKLVAVIDELEGAEQADTKLASGGHSFSASGVLPIQSTILYSARLSDGVDSKLSPGLRLAGVKTGLFASQPSELPELLGATDFGVAFSNKLDYQVGGLRLTGEWTKVDAEFDKGATADQDIKKLVGKTRRGYGLDYSFGNGFNAFRSYSRETDQSGKKSDGQEVESTKTGFAFGQDGDPTTFRFLIDETTTELARANAAGGEKKISTEFGHSFNWGGDGNASFSFGRQELQRWGSSQNGKIKDLPTLSLGFTRHASANGQKQDDETKGKGKKGEGKDDGPPVRTSFSHTVTENGQGSTGDYDKGDSVETLTQLSHNFSWGGQDAKFSFTQRDLERWGAVKAEEAKKGIETFGLSFERADTTISHTVTDKVKGSTGDYSSGDSNSVVTQFGQGFKFRGEKAQFTYTRARDSKWGNEDDPSATTTSTVDLMLPVTQRLKLTGRHETSVRDSDAEKTYRRLVLNPVGDSKFKGSKLTYETTEQGGARAFGESVMTLNSQTVALPFETKLQGNFIRTARDGSGAYDRAQLSLTASSKPIEALTLNANYSSDAHSDDGKAANTSLKATYALTELVSVNMDRTREEHDGELMKGNTSLTLARKAAHEGGLGVEVGYSKREQHGKEIDPETLLKFTHGSEDGLYTTALYKHRSAGPDEYGAQLAFSAGAIRTTASYTVNGFDAARKTQDPGSTFDLHADWKIKEGLELTTGMRISSAARLFAGGIGPRLMLKGKLSKNEELMVGYVPTASALKDKNTATDFTAGAQDIKKDIEGTSASSCIVRYTKIVDADHLLVAYFRTGALRLDNGMDNGSGNPFADKSAWLEVRTSF
jgi:hypothetical protein